jgi:hypothetical protein
MDAWALISASAEGTQHRSHQVRVAVSAFEVLAKPGCRVDSGRDVHRDPPQVVVWKLLLEVDAVIVASGG